MKLLAGKRLYAEALKVYDESQKDGVTLSAVAYSCLINFAVEVEEPDRARAFFDKLTEITTPSIRGYMSILRLYSQKGMWEEGIALLGHMQERNVPVDILVLNMALGACVRAEKLSAAEDLLESFKSVRDVISFNNVIKAYANAGNYKKAVDMVAKIKESGLCPSMVTYNTAMDACVRAREYEAAWEVAENNDLQADEYTVSTLAKTLPTMRWKIPQLLSYLSNIETSNTHSCMVVYTKIIEYLGKDPDVESLKILTRQLWDRKMMLAFPSLTALMRCLRSHGELDDAFIVWDLRGDRRPPISFFQVTLDLAMQYQFSQNVAPMRTLMDWLKTARLSCKKDPTIELMISTVVKSYIRRRMVDEAMKIYYDFRDAMKHARSAKPHFEASIYSELIRAQMAVDEQRVTHMTRIRCVMELLEDMRVQGLVPESESVDSIFASCYRHWNVEGASTIFLRLHLSGVRLNEETLTTVYKLYLQVDPWEEACELVNTMTTCCGVQPTPAILATVIQGFAKSGRDDKIQQIYDWMKKMNIQADASVWNVLPVYAEKTRLLNCMTSPSFAAA